MCTSVETQAELFDWIVTEVSLAADIGQHSLAHCLAVYSYHDDHQF